MAHSSKPYSRPQLLANAAIAVCGRNNPAIRPVVVQMARLSNINKTSKEYRRLAKRCRELARTVSAASERADLLARAQTWELLADRVPMRRAPTISRALSTRG
jgi:hypothetical protein